MKAAQIFCCACLLAGCATVPGGIEDAALPQTMHADLIFAGRIISSEEAYLIYGDVSIEAQERTFEAVNQPGASVVAYDQNICPPGDLGDNALLVFLRKDSGHDRSGAGGAYIVYACPVVDAATVERIRRHEVHFGSQAPD